MNPIILRFTRVVLLMATCGFPLASLALYDPAPAAALAAVEGAWRGTLEYRDYQPPFKRVTLPTTVNIVVSSPNELTLHYVFNDGPKKTVHSYDRLAIDLDAKTLRMSGLKADDVTTAAIVGSTTVDGVLEVIAEREEESKGVVNVVRYRIRLGTNVVDILKTSGPKGRKVNSATSISSGANPASVICLNGIFNFVEPALVRLAAHLRLEMAANA